MATDQHHILQLPLEGVESEHCALIVDNGLEKVKGIDTHRVELNNNRAILTTTDAAVIPEAVKAIRALGYGVTTAVRNFPVLNMTCASCAVSVESMIKAQPGVVNASVNFANSSLRVEYVAGLTNAEDLRKAVQSIGYDLLVTEEGRDAGESLEDLQHARLKQLKLRTLGAILLSLPVVVIGMFFMEMPYANFIMWALSTPVVWWFGRDFFTNAWKQATHGSANMDTLVALSTGVAYTFSVFNTLWPGFWLSRGLHPHVYFEAAAVVITFILLGKLLEDKAKGNTSAAIRKLMGLQPKTVTVVHEGGHQMAMPVEKVKPGDTLLVKPGDKIPVDGTVLNGESFVDESTMSGEPVPVLKKKGDPVLAGTLNQKGSFQFRAEKVGSETLLAQIIQLVQDAQGSKAPVQRLVDRIAAIFVPVVIAIALAAFLSWWLLGGDNGFTHGLMALVTVLVIACPCALGLATPTAIMVGVGKGAEQGILIKDAESLELARNIQAVVLDKTGTITEGRPRVTHIYWKNNDPAEAPILNSIERQSGHPLAEAVIQHLEGEAILPVEQFESITGKGVRANHNGKTYWVGNAQLIRENSIAVNEQMSAKAEEWTRLAKTVIWFANEHETLAVIAIADNVKKSSAEAIARLKQMGIEVHMLTGDNEATAKAIAAETGIGNTRAGVLPHEKADYIKKLQARGKIVAMVGDGINDSTALAQADVSIAMGKGSDIAMDVARMTIISSDLNRIPAAILLSRQTVAAIRQNLFWAFIYNLIGIPVAAGVLYPFTGFLLNPMIAGAAMALSSVSVVGNSLRLKWKK